MSRSIDYLLIPDSNPIPVIPQLAELVGINAAVILQQVHYWCEMNRKGKTNYRNGHYWTYGSYAEWAKQFSWMGESTIRNNIGKLERLGLLVSGNYNRHKYDKTKWYRVCVEQLEAMVPAAASADDIQNRVPSAKNEQKVMLENSRPISETNTEIKNVNNDNNGSLPPGVDTDRHSFSFNGDTARFINWYRTALYPKYYGSDHPTLSQEQLRNIHDRLLSFQSEFYVDMEGLCEMAKSFFENVSSNDHHLHHFVSGDMLQIRFYDCGIY